MLVELEVVVEKMVTTLMIPQDTTLQPSRSDGVDGKFHQDEDE
jgi:hypothetical protein